WERLGRRLDVYGRLLALFSEDLREVLPRLDEWWQMGDAGALQAWLHTTKGLSATLGHVRMAAAVAEAAQALQAGGIAAQPPAWWRAMRAAVQDAIPECLRLSAVLAAQVMAPAPTRSGDDAERRLREALPVLLDCLERSDMKALDLYESLQGDGLSCEAPRWRDLCDSMSRLDFPAAAQQVRQAMAELLENQA
ncbi:MAG TPA: Hpt domain-containing protein, partial [Aquabacterium sp.]|nr:Hpt domain-containing protein [Aquabacterium sp.]